MQKKMSAQCISESSGGCQGAGGREKGQEESLGEEGMGMFCIMIGEAVVRCEHLSKLIKFSPGWGSSMD